MNFNKNNKNNKILTIDIGTSILKGGVFNTSGELLSICRTPIPFIKSQDPCHFEINPFTWISGLKQICADMKLSNYPEIVAIVISGNGPTLLPVDRDGNPLYPAITWMDRRNITGEHITSDNNSFNVNISFFLAKALWIFRNKGDIYEKTHYFLSCPEYLDFFLTGNAFTILPAPQFKNYIWTEKAIESLGMDKQKFPPFIKPGELIGPLRRKAAEELGLKQNIPVLAGGPDFIMSLIGTGAMTSGATCDRAGTSEGINHCSKNPVNDKRLLCLPHIAKGLFNISGMISTTGKALNWFWETGGYNDKDNDHYNSNKKDKDIKRRGYKDYKTIFNDASDVPPGSHRLIFLPYLAGERSPIWEPDSRGAFIGLSLTHGRKEMARAVVESIGYAIRNILDVMEENKLHIEELRVAGSLASYNILNQIKADITGKIILIPEIPDSELMGDACLGLAALGIFENVVEASQKCVKMKSRFFPRREYCSLYNDMFALFKQSHNQLKSVFTNLAKI